MNKTAALLLILLAACGRAPDNEPPPAELRAQEAATPFKEQSKDYTAPADAPENDASAPDMSAVTSEATPKRPSENPVSTPPEGNP